MKASDLLVIDVAGELRNLCREQLRGSWQIAAEVVRFCISRGASAVAFNGRRKGFSVRGTGCRSMEAELRDLSVVLDPVADRVRCHDALVRLEKAEAMALLWMAGVEGASVSVVGGGGGGSFTFEPGAGAMLDEDAAAGGDGILEVSFQSPDFDRSRAVGWLETAVRFSPVEVNVDGKSAVRGFDDSLAGVRINRPLAGRLSVGWTGDAPQLWLLRHGVVATRAMVPSYPAFTAALEMADEARPESTPAELREAVNPHLNDLIDAAVRLMISVGRRAKELDDPARRRVSCLLLRAAVRGLRRDEITRLPMISRRGPGSSNEELLSLREVAEMAREQSGVVVALPSGEPRGRGPLPAAPVVVLSDEERGLLTDLLDIRIEHPPRRVRGGLMRWVITGIRRVASWIRGRVRGGLRGVEVPDDELLEAERRLLALLDRNAGGVVEVRLCAGGGGPHRRGRRLLLPRNNPLVAGSVRLVESDDRWLYPAAAALLGERLAPTGELRAKWLRIVLG